jgi:hypothetical protein
MYAALASSLPVSPEKCPILATAAKPFSNQLGTNDSFLARSRQGINKQLSFK